MIYRITYIGRTDDFKVKAYQSVYNTDTECYEFNEDGYDKHIHLDSIGDIKILTPTSISIEGLKPIIVDMYVVNENTIESAKEIIKNTL